MLAKLSQLTLSIALGLTLGLFFALGCASPDPDKITAEDAKALITSSGAVLLDVRTADEYNDSHVEGAMFIPIGELDERSGELDRYRDKPILVYCRSGRRSVDAVELLKSKGYNAKTVKGGIDKLEAAGLPVKHA